MKKLFTSGIIIILGSILFYVFLPSCKKENPEYPVSIIVQYKGNDKPVDNAFVKIYKNNVDVELTTDASGNCKYTFNLPAILQVYAKKDTSKTSDSTAVGWHRPVTGTTIIRLLENESIEKTVYLQ